MREKERGQIFILVLILLAVGSLLLVPLLRLTDTSLKLSRVPLQQSKAMYAADAAQEYILWKLIYDNFGAEFENDGDNQTVSFDSCGIPVAITVIMRAAEGKGAITLATDDVIRPTKTVEPSTVPNDTPTTFTYTIRLEQLSDNKTQGLDAVYDILPRGFEDDDFQFGQCRMKIDNGPWLPVNDPFVEEEGGQVRLRWPADYDPETGTGAFSSDPLDVDHYFHGMRDFNIRQVKELEFQIAGEMPDDEVHCNWVVLKPWNTLSGPQAPLTVGSPDVPEACSGDGLLVVENTANPDVIERDVETDVEYTISITNIDGETHHIEQITNYLPPGFAYTANSTSGLTTSEPQLTLKNLNGLERWELMWTEDEFPGGNTVSIHSGETLTMSFWVLGVLEDSGTYYNEVMVLPDKPVPTILREIGVEREDYSTAYSWNAGTITVPGYDSQTQVGDLIINSNISLIMGGITITSWQVQ